MIVAQLKDKHKTYIAAIKEELRETVEKENVEGQSLQALVDSTKRDKVIEVTMARGERDRGIVEANSCAMDEVRNTFDLAQHGAILVAYVPLDISHFCGSKELVITGTSSRASKDVAD
ncbi:hypothetical protein GOBAR_DD26578 [Gossypium barbadense]|nr:hypothetical protein GOBAR_DD26578 [Gossypium barbadense]